MIKVQTKLGVTNIVESAAELPSLDGVTSSFMDFETTLSKDWEKRTGKDRKKAVRPYNGDRICGAALLRDDEPEAWYIPIRHTNKKWNIPMDAFLPWLKDAVTKPEEWINSNVKFDVHFAVQDDAMFDCDLVDTLVESKMHNSDRWSHDLKSVVPEWLGLSMDQEDRIEAWLSAAGTTDYARVPADIMGAYAGEDVHGTRALHKFLMENKEPQIVPCWEMEKKLTKVLWDMEHRGLRINPLTCRRELLMSLRRMVEWAEELERLTNSAYVDSNTHLFDLFIVQLGLPILSYTKTTDPATGRKVLTDSPSFDKDALALYSIHPQVSSNKKTMRIVELVKAFRTESHFKSLFLESYLDRVDDNGYIHPTYNQLIRTGRMSSKGPNSQQLNKRAKKLILPDEDEIFFSADASQIEFRIMVHYIKDEQAIAAYRDDPNTDFHQWVADLCRIQRDPAKNVNFAMGYGAGKRKVVSMLRNDPDVMREVGARVRAMLEHGEIQEKDMNRVYLNLCGQRAAEIYHTYHERLPGIKRLSKKAMQDCKRRGFVFTAFGRRRHLGNAGAHKAFNSAVQGTAMDYIKFAMNEIAPRFCEWTRSLGIELRVNVHDELLFSGSPEVLGDKRIQDRIIRQLEEQPIPFRVPFIWSGGESEETWADAA